MTALSALSGIPNAWTLAPREPAATQKRNHAAIEWIWKLAIVVVSVGVLGLYFTYHPQKLAAQILWYSTTGRALLIAGGVYASVAVYWSVWRLVLALRYKPFPLVPDAKLPRITVVVPAYNEGALVGQTLRHLARANYPINHMEIIVVDDGSDDDTWEHIDAASREIGPLVTAVRCPTNRGKRWALWEGFRRATGSIFVTVDSDSLISPDALRHLVSPMVSDARVGGVAGNVRVLNRDQGLIPAMLSVRYVMTFDYKRAAQSVMGGGAVLCCAGALAAYRKNAVMPILDKWLHQTFRGGPARAGEDHAMTNFILSQGHKVVYQRTAKVLTKSPTTYSGLCKMFLRWARSNIRESFHTATFVFRKFRPEAANRIRFNFIMCAVGLALPYPFLACGIVLSIFLPTIFGVKMLATCVTGALLPFIFYAIRERKTDAIYAMVYSFYSMWMISWIYPYALFTCDRSVWMTRVSCKDKANGGTAPAQAEAEHSGPALVLATAPSKSPRLKRLVACI